MAISSQTTEEKERFFRDLDHLGDSGEETESASEDERQIALRLAATRPADKIRSPPRLKPEVIVIKDSPEKARKSTTSTLQTVKAIQEVIVIEDSPVKLRGPITTTLPTIQKPNPTRKRIRKRNEEATKKAQPQHPQANRAESRSTRKGKKKADNDIQLLPENQRIFDGLVFFFVPNNDISKPRRKRIQGSIARGAMWAQTYNDEITHIIVDISLNITSVTRAFDGRQIPEGAIALKDTWLIDSFVYGSIQNENASRYTVDNPAQNSSRDKAAPVSFQESPDRFPHTRKRKARELYETPPRESPPVYSDELGTIMEEMKGLPGAPPISGESDNESLASSVPETVINEISDTESQLEQVRIPHENRGFLCMEKNDGQQDNPNARTIEILQGMASYYDRTGDQWRTLSYRKGMTALRKQKVLIKTKEEAIRIAGIGSRLAGKIEEIVTTNRLQRLENTKNEPGDVALQLFMGVYGVGYKQASKWITKGYRTLDDLVREANLSENQKIGVEHYYDFQQRIPRAEVAQHGDIVRRALLKADPQFEIIIGGSYRRGNIDSGDIDCLITKKDANMDQIRTLMMGTVIPDLESQGLLKAALATSSIKHASKWHGASCLPESITNNNTSTTDNSNDKESNGNLWRRIDLLFVPWSELGAALLYFTGNDIFNRSMRLLASKKGWRLNQHGLYSDVVRGDKREKLTDGVLLEGRSEKRIFELLAVPWRPPHERKC